LDLLPHDKKAARFALKKKNNRKDLGSLPTKIVGKLEGMKRIKAA
jgi:hypothetical protein